MAAVIQASKTTGSGDGNDPPSGDEAKSKVPDSKPDFDYTTDECEEQPVLKKSGRRRGKFHYLHAYRSEDGVIISAFLSKITSINVYTSPFRP